MPPMPPVARPWGRELGASPSALPFQRWEGSGRGGLGAAGQGAAALPGSDVMGKWLSAKCREAADGECPLHCAESCY